MKTRFSVSILSALIVCLTVAPSHAAPGLFAHGSGDGALWIAQTTTDPKAKERGPFTIIRYRGVNEESWTEAGRISGRVLGIASRGSQLAVLQETGDWMLIWPGGSLIGPSIPGRTQLRALGSDGETLWAIAVVTGELPASRPGLSSTRAATQSAPPAVTSTPAEAGPIVPPRVMLLRLDRDAWQPVGRLEAPIDSQFAIAGVRGRPLIAARDTAGTVRLFDQTRHLNDITTGDASRFAVLTHDANWLLWTAGPVGAGEIQPLARDASVAALAAPAGQPVNGERAVTIATGRLRLFFVRNERDQSIVYEQKYDLKDWKPVAEPVALAFPVPAVDSTLQTVINAVVLAALVFAMVASFQHRRSVRELMLKPDRPVAAPMMRRLLAGLIDLAPIFAASVVVYIILRGYPNLSLAMQDWRVELALIVGPALYVLHTTATEAIWGRSLGKMIVGLKVISLEGGRPSTGMLILRNVLRIIDLFVPPMLVLMFVSPLRQRAGDIASGTMVVRSK